MVVDEMPIASSDFGLPGGPMLSKLAIRPIPHCQLQVDNIGLPGRPKSELAIRPIPHCQLQDGDHWSPSVRLSFPAILPVISSHNVKPCPKIYHTVAEMA